MADKWYEGFWANLLQDIGIEHWYHRSSRVSGQAAPGTTATSQPQAPRKPLVPPAIVLGLSREERRTQASRFRRKLGDISAWSEEDQQKLVKLPQEEMREFLEIYYPTLKERWGKFKEAVGRLDDNLQASPETKAQLDRWGAWFDRLARWLGRRS